MSRKYQRTRPLTSQRAHELAANPDRSRLLEQIMSAGTRQEIAAARHAQWAWLVANPDDFGVLEAGEDLAHAEEALAAREGASVPRATSV